ncbi:MAG: phosphoribosylamine--glycine ligase [Bacteroidetes bacterium]|nr:phosphoribosylamine--glycine ligase [Bacteroidota bacterium]
MNILILGGGGREHALAWKIKQSPLCDNLYIAPGNAGTAKVGTNVDFAATSFEEIANFSSQNDIGMIVCGPEDPLVKGLRDFIATDVRTKDIYFIGPNQQGAALEGSKDFSKQFMIRNQVPTAKHISVSKDNLEEGKKYIQEMKMPVVLKADGLAAGKGVIILDNIEEAKQTLENMINGMFGEASNTVLIEEFLKGIELSVFVLTDGEHYVVLPEAKDYKRIGEGDTGLNTGGMGAVSPVPFANEAFMDKIEQQIIIPTVEGLKKDNINYKGFIFIGIMKVGDEPYVIEYNCRLGDPETEVILPRIENDLVELFVATEKQELDNIKLNFSKDFCTTVIMVSGGYPGDYTKGDLMNIQTTNPMVFHAGTKQQENNIYTNGGRVIACTAKGNSLEDAINSSYELTKEIQYKDSYFRRDIGQDLKEYKA